MLENGALRLGLEFLGGGHAHGVAMVRLTFWLAETLTDAFTDALPGVHCHFLVSQRWELTGLRWWCRRSGWLAETPKYKLHF